MSKKEMLEQKEDDEDFLLDTMAHIKNNSLKMNANLTNIFKE